ncbi:hypothetical protein R1flu_002269 [Riccia fluitans]|uniref:Dynein light chain n=1 Tax=Riccia fluitans TaxID=41844 RepID=A0ABD1Y5M9_9MARC
MARAILEEGVFLADEINGIIKDSIDEAIVSSQFSHDKVTHWTNGIAEVCMKRLTNLAKPFKYIGSRTIRWENKSMYVIVTVFGIAI